MLFNTENRKFAVRQVDRTIARVAATCSAIIILLQAVPNAFTQKASLTELGFWLGVGVIGSILLAQVVAAWLGKKLIWLYLALHVATVIGIVTWPLAIRPGVDWSDGTQPWFWWLLAIATFNAFAAYRPVPAFGAAILLNGLWLVLSTTEPFGSRPIGVSLQDTLLAFFFGALMGLLLIALRQQTAKIDIAMEQRAETSAASARIRAAESERARMNALVHDAVLTTLIIGANAETSSEVQQAATSAREAMSKLVSDFTDAAPADISVSAFFDSLAQAAGEVASDLDVVIEQNQDIKVPSAVAAAFTQATIQALTNSVQHAGTVKHRQLRLSSTAARFKVVVLDDGRGFRESRIPKHRLGVRLSIRQRITSVGGRIAIQSQPGQGCTITMIWSLVDDQTSEVQS